MTRLDNKGVVPNSGMDRTSINLRSTAKLSKWLSADVKVNYVSQHTNNRVKLAGDPDNIFLNYLSMPRSVGFSDYDAYKDNDWKRADGKPAGYLIDTGANANNPYWSAYRNTNKDMYSIRQTEKIILILQMTTASITRLWKCTIRQTRWECLTRIPAHRILTI